MKRILLTLSSLLLFSLFFIKLPSLTTEADDCNLLCLETRIKDLARQLELSQAATKPLEDTLNKMEREISDIQKRIGLLQAGIKEKEQELISLRSEINKGEKDLTHQEEILATRVRSFYKRNRLFSPIVIFLAQKKAADLARELVYRQATTQEDKKMITKIVLFLKDLDDKKQKSEDLKNELESETTRLAKAKEDIDKQAEFFRKEVTGAKSFQAKLSSDIATLTSRQQEILNAKTGLFSTSVGDVPLADDSASRPDYNPGFSPAFAAFSFGAPHFKGMSQYGAFGRAMSGQNEEDIIKAYYGDVKIEQKGDLPGDIETTVGTLSFEDNYLKGIAEMPSSWDANNLAALKAQAIAARSYAMVHGKPICVDEGCQVYSSSKAGNPPDNWRRAVEETRGKVIVSNQSGQIISAWYASTSGGYQESYSTNGHTTPGFWDTKNGRSGWTGDAYEKISGSPWFYKAWYRTRSGASCGRSSPWLTSEEFADIVNAAIVYEKGGDMSGVFPEDVQSCFGGGDTPWSKDRLREEAGKNGGGVSSVSSVSVQYREDGLTGKVTIDGREFDGQAFRKAFNLRAPGAINLKSGLYNIERK